LFVDDSALKKRIRRHVIAANWDFFAVTAPGLEKVCRSECANFSFLSRHPRIVEGGVECSGRVNHVYKTNLYIRTANRIIMRIGGFKATNFRQLEKRLDAFSWELFFKPGTAVKIHVSAIHSRLYHTKAVSDRILLKLKNVLSCLPGSENFSENFLQTLYVRIVDDFVTLSLDSSGDILYKRGIKIHGGRAPLRETIACAALMIAGYKGDEPLIDPMCGSGTFSLEAAMMAQHIPAGWFRSFAFQYWPCFSDNRWNFIRKQAQKQLLYVKNPIVFASDIDSRACNELRKCVNKNKFDNIIKIKEGQDFFTLCPENLTKTRGLVVLNPPYGLRIEPFETTSEKLFKEIFKKLKKDYKQWKVAVIVPNRRIAQSAAMALKSHCLFHGGLKLFLLYGIIPR
jgi:putative N6-adenine-specific DNA methylase